MYSSLLWTLSNEHGPPAMRAVSSRSYQDIITDDASSQFKNRYITDVVKLLMDIHNVIIVWHYFATSPGRVFQIFTFSSDQDWQLDWGATWGPYNTQKISELKIEFNMVSIGLENFRNYAKLRFYGMRYFSYFIYDYNFNMC